MKMRGTVGMGLALALALPLVWPCRADQEAAGEGSAEQAAAKTAPAGKKASAPAEKPTRPPKNLKKLPDGHWTPWDPPAPPEGASVHVVVPGDTLWDLSAHYLNDPYLWPQIWDQNRYILDSHWIYPGDPIIVPAPEVVPQEGAGAPVAEVEEEEEEEARPPAPPPPPPPPKYPIGDEQDYRCAAYIQDHPLADEPSIVGCEEEDLIGIGQGTIVYVNVGREDGMKPGDSFTIVRDGGMVKHPATRDVLGHRVDMMGILSLIAVQESTATAEIAYACQDVLRGDRLIPYREARIPTRDRPFSQKIDRYDSAGSGKTSGYLVISKDPQIALGQGNVVAVDLGASSGMKPGDLLTIYRPNPQGQNLPRLNLGEGVVLRTEPISSVVRISTAVREIYLGDRVEMR